MRAIIYVRVSTDAQERDGTSLDTQERACVERVHTLGWSVLEVIRLDTFGSTVEETRASIEGAS